MRRYTLRAPRERAEEAVARMLELFPDGVEQEDDGADVLVAGYGDGPAPDGLAGSPVDPGWETRWREFHRPARAGRLWVGPPWCDPEPIAVVIDPGRAFGTGAHGSTRAALALLQELEPGPALDVGCGSGVLSIAAARLGFGPLRACDVDPLAVDATRENAARNGVSVEAFAADALADPLPTAPLWLANLQLDLLERLLGRPDVPPLVLASGLLADQTLGGAPRAVVDGWAAEVLAR